MGAEVKGVWHSISYNRDTKSVVRNPLQATGTTAVISKSTNFSESKFSLFF